MTTYHLIFIICTILLNCNTITSKKWSEASEDKCKFTINHDDDIQFATNPLLFINKHQVTDLPECRRVCCNHDSCNGYVWDANEKENCKLLKCSNEGNDCKRALSAVVNKQLHEVGFITGVTDSSPEVNTKTAKMVTPTATRTTINATKTLRTTTNPPTRTAASNFTIETMNKLKALLSGVPQSSNSTQKNVDDTSDVVSKINDNNDDDGDVNRDGKQQNSVKNVSLTSTTATPKTTTRVSTTTIYHTTVRMKGVIKTGVGNTHSDSASLAVALLFGLAFFLATVYLVGKRWVESLRESHRRSYTRISYLLNGV